MANTRESPPADSGASHPLHGLAPGSSAWWSTKATPGALPPSLGHWRDHDHRSSTALCPTAQSSGAVERSTIPRLVLPSRSYQPLAQLALIGQRVWGVS